MVSLLSADRFSLSLSKPVRKNVKVFSVNFILQYVSLSKRFVPEAVNFLAGILFLASKKESPARKYQLTPCAFQFNIILCMVGEIYTLFLVFVLTTSLLSSILKQSNIARLPPSPRSLIESE